MKKRLISFLLACTLILGTLPFGASAAATVASGTIGDNLTWTLDADGVLTISGQGYMSIVAGENPWAEFRGQIRSVKLEKGICSISSGAFAGCSKLSDCVLPDTICSIGENAFRGCGMLTSMDIPIGVTHLNWNTFFGCSGLKSVTIPHGMEYIASQAFYNCTSLTSVTLPSTLRYLGGAAFGECTNLKNVYFNGDAPYATNTNVFCLEDDTPIPGLTLYYREDCSGWDTAAWNGCPMAVWEGTDYPHSYSGSCGTNATWHLDESGLLTISGHGDMVTGIWTLWAEEVQAIVIEEGITSIDGCAFSGMTQLRSVQLPVGLKTIGSHAFSNCCSLQKLSLPEGITDIHASAFFYCSKLTSLILPESLERIRTGAFSYCTALRSLYFRGAAPTIDPYSFARSRGGGIFELNTDLTLYYVDGKAGWTTPTWNGIRTAVWSGTPVNDTFSDVEEGQWYWEAVQFAADRAILQGDGKGNLMPNAAMTRAQLVQVLYNLANRTEVAYTPKFTDVKECQWFAPAVLWAAENDIVSGIGNGSFDPNGEVTREQMAAILFRYFQSEGENTSHRSDLSAFPDCKAVSDWAFEAMQWATAAHLINGVKSGDSILLAPQQSASRAQVAQVIFNYLVKS